MKQEQSNWSVAGEILWETTKIVCMVSYYACVLAAMIGWYMFLIPFAAFTSASVGCSKKAVRG